MEVRAPPYGSHCSRFRFYTQEWEGTHVPWNDGTLLPVEDANGVVRFSLRAFLFNAEIKNVVASTMATSTTPIMLTLHAFIGSTATLRRSSCFLPSTLSSPNQKLSTRPRLKPFAKLSQQPSSASSRGHSSKPSQKVSTMPIQQPSSKPSPMLSAKPSQTPSSNPSHQPSSKPNHEASTEPSQKSGPAKKPVAKPSQKPYYTIR